MNLIDTLKSLGGVKPCPHTHDGPNMGVMADNMFISARGVVPCPLCHGTGTVLDLSPLLAKSSILEEAVKFLIAEWSRISGQTWRHVYSIGPQRASNLVFECARQLGGTAVVAKTNPTDTRCTHCARAKLYLPLNEQRSGGITCKHRKQYNPDRKRGPVDSFNEFSLPCAEFSPRLSLPVPPDATVLFVTDRVTKEDSNYAVFRAVESTGQVDPMKILPYILCLVNGYGEDKVDYGMNVIALHKEST